MEWRDPGSVLGAPRASCVTSGGGRYLRSVGLGFPTCNVRECGAPGPVWPLQPCEALCKLMTRSEGTETVQGPGRQRPLLPAFCGGEARPSYRTALPAPPHRELTWTGCSARFRKPAQTKQCPACRKALRVYWSHHVPGRAWKQNLSGWRRCSENGSTAATLACTSESEKTLPELHWR